MRINHSVSKVYTPAIMDFKFNTERLRSSKRLPPINTSTHSINGESLVYKGDTVIDGQQYQAAIRKTDS